MATGILGQSAPPALTNTIVYTVPSATVATVNINVCNRSDNDSVYIRLALAASQTPSIEEYIEYDTVLQPNAVLERSGIVLNAAKKVVVWVSSYNVSVSVYGYEE
jgi:hypothetical protein